MTVFLSLLVALVGLLMYILAGNPKIQNLGLVMFGAGVLAFLLTGDAVISLIGK